MLGSLVPRELGEIGGSCLTSGAIHDKKEAEGENQQIICLSQRHFMLGACCMTRKKVGLIGLLIIGLAALAGYFYLSRSDRNQPSTAQPSVVEPGLGLKDLHNQGYSGRGVHVALIDGLLRADHEEFADHLVHLEKVGTVNEADLYHGTTVASVLVGKRCGVVPEASLHFFAANFADGSNVIRALERVLLHNDALEPPRKIRIVSISTGIPGESESQADFHRLVSQAWDQGIIVFTSTMPTITNPPFALREAAYDKKQDLNNLDNIVIGEWMNEFLRENNISREDLVAIRKARDLENGYINLYLPCAGRYVASPDTESGYVYDLDGGLSWGTPLLAGLAALTLQVNPDLTNDEVLGLLGESVLTNQQGLDVIDPQLLITLARATIE